MAQVISPEGKVKNVQNLGWLLRHWKDVESFQVFALPENTVWRAELRANLKDGRIYQTEFASESVLWNWLDRPVFKGALLNWAGEKTVCGSPSFNHQKAFGK